MKILAVVKFNSGVALVLDTPLNKKYTKYGNTIIGVDDILASIIWIYCAQKEGVQQ